MKKIKKYRYIGTNGVLISPIFLEDIKNTPMYSISADYGYILTNGNRKAYSITIEETDLINWKEIKDNTKQEN